MPNRNQSRNSSPAPKRPKRAPHCCRCNGTNACCKFCACAKAGRVCTCCLPAQHGKCSNSNNRTALFHDSASRPSQPLAGTTTCSSDTQQLPSSQPMLQQLQASSEPTVPSLSAEHPQPSSTIDPPSPFPCLTIQQSSSRSYSSSQHSRRLYLEMESDSVTCCKCHTSGARCTSCKCCREERPCVNCYPGRRGKCTNIVPSNAVILPASPPQPDASLQPHSALSLPLVQGPSMPRTPSPQSPPTLPGEQACNGIWPHPAPPSPLRGRLPLGLML